MVVNAYPDHMLYCVDPYLTRGLEDSEDRAAVLLPTGGH